MLISSMILMIFMMMMIFIDKDFCTISTVMPLSGRNICTYRLLHQSVHSDTKYKNERQMCSL